MSIASLRITFYKLHSNCFWICSVNIWKWIVKLVPNTFFNSYYRATAPSEPGALHCRAFTNTLSWTHHIRLDSSGRVISPTQRSLPNNTKHSPVKDVHNPGRMQTHNPNRRATADPLLILIFSHLAGKKLHRNFTHPCSSNYPPLLQILTEINSGASHIIIVFIIKINLLFETCSY
jgi:hypothetical protein